MDLVIRGKGLGEKDKNKVRTWDRETNGPLFPDVANQAVSQIVNTAGGASNDK